MMKYVNQCCQYMSSKKGHCTWPNIIDTRKFLHGRNADKNTSCNKDERRAQMVKYVNLETNAANV
jgi:hypothetical protein